MLYEYGLPLLHWLQRKLTDLDLYVSSWIAVLTDGGDE